MLLINENKINKKKIIKKIYLRIIKLKNNDEMINKLKLFSLLINNLIALFCFHNDYYCIIKYIFINNLNIKHLFLKGI